MSDWETLSANNRYTYKPGFVDPKERRDLFRIYTMIRKDI